MRPEPVQGPMRRGPAAGMLEDMDFLQIISTVVIVGGVVVTALIAIIPSVVNR